MSGGHRHGAGRIAQPARTWQLSSQLSVYFIKILDDLSYL